MLLNWLRKRLGCHVCEEWTRWKDGSSVVYYVTDAGRVIGHKVVHYQERVCTLCGAKQTRPVRHGPTPPGLAEELRRAYRDGYEGG